MAKYVKIFLPFWYEKPFAIWGGHILLKPIYRMVTYRLLHNCNKKIIEFALSILQKKNSRSNVKIVSHLQMDIFCLSTFAMIEEMASAPPSCSSS